MSKVYICNEDTGRKMYYGNDSDAKVSRFISAGHSQVTERQPNDTDKWDGAAWISDSGLVKDKSNLAASRKRASEYPSTQDQLDALLAGGQAVVDMKVRVDAVKANNPIT